MSAETDIEVQLRAFARAMTTDPVAEVRTIQPLPGHAGQSYSFELETHGQRQKLVLRVAPPGVRIAGTADIARQGRIMASLAETAVPVPAIRWLDDDPRWFGRPYFVAEFVTGDKLALRDHEFSATAQPALGRLTIAMLAAPHSVPWESPPTSWGEPLTLTDEVAPL